MSSCWANGTFVGLCESSSPTTIVNETTKALRTNCSTVRLQNDAAVPCVVVGESVEFSATTTGQPHRPEARSILGQNGIPDGPLKLTVHVQSATAAERNTFVLSSPSLNQVFWRFPMSGRKRPA